MSFKVIYGAAPSEPKLFNRLVHLPPPPAASHLNDCGAVSARSGVESRERERGGGERWRMEKRAPRLGRSRFLPAATFFFYPLSTRGSHQNKTLTNKIWVDLPAGRKTRFP